MVKNYFREFAKIKYRENLFSVFYNKEINLDFLVICLNLFLNLVLSMFIYLKSNLLFKYMNLESGNKNYHNIKNLYHNIHHPLYFQEAN